MSVFDRLPDELVVKIYLCLKDDRDSIRSMIATCRRFRFIVQDYLIHEPAWIESEPLGLCITEFDYDGVDPDGSRTALERLTRVEYGPYLTINTILFFLWNNGQVDCPALDWPQVLDSTFRPEYIVELKFVWCEIKSIWFNSILNNLPNLATLELLSTSFKIEPNTPSLAAKRLKHLRLSGDEWLEDAAVHASFFNLSPALLDLSGPFVERDNLLKTRNYGTWLSFIEKHSDTLEYLILTYGDIDDDELIELATKKSLRNLRISALHCPQITRKSTEFIESSRLGHRIEICNECDFCIELYSHLRSS